MVSHLKDLIIGPALPTQAYAEQRLDKIRALAAFSPDALASIAYANQEIYLGLVVAGSAGLAYGWPISVAIAGLLAIVALSYFQTIHAYPSGGGSYIVAKSNLGALPGLVAASALLIDYLLNAAVSLTAGVAAIASAFPVLWPFRIHLALLLLLVVTLVNLRGMHEAGTVMAVPVYSFIVAYLGLIVVGIFRIVVQGAAQAPGQPQIVPEHQAVTMVLILHAFATGCTALTGIEAISNGVPSFRAPESRNAGRTLLLMALMMSILFLGTNGLTQVFAVSPRPDETILSALARQTVGTSVFYFLIQFSTLAILTVAANTSFAGFPRLAAILAGDSYLPRQLSSLGDRLGFTNGVMLLSVGTAGLIVLFGGDTHALIPLFAVGAFLAFTLSQAGMVRHWIQQGGAAAILKAGVNGLGSMATGAALLVVAYSKFTEGAWLSILLIPVIVLAFQGVHGHYEEIRKELSLHGLPPSLRPVAAARVVIPISSVHRGIVSAVLFAQSISQNVTGVYVELEPGSGKKVLRAWKEWWPDLPLAIVPSPFRSLVGSLMEFLEQTDAEHNDGQLAVVVLPEFVTSHWWQSLLHNQTAILIKAALLYGRRKGGGERLVVDVPYHLKK